MPTTGTSCAAGTIGGEKTRGRPERRVGRVHGGWAMWVRGVKSEAGGAREISLIHLLRCKRFVTPCGNVRSLPLIAESVLYYYIGERVEFFFARRIRCCSTRFSTKLSWKRFSVRILMSTIGWAGRIGAARKNIFILSSLTILTDTYCRHENDKAPHDTMNSSLHYDYKWYKTY